MRLLPAPTGQIDHAIMPIPGFMDPARRIDAAGLAPYAYAAAVATSRDQS